MSEAATPTAGPRRGPPAGGSRLVTPSVGPRALTLWFTRRSSLVCAFSTSGLGGTPPMSSRARPPGAKYVGLDISPDELAAAPHGGYDDVVVGDIAKLRTELCDEFDPVVSWQVGEHVWSPRAAMDNAYADLRPGGWMVALFSGRWSIFALLNRLFSLRFGKQAMARLLDRDPKSVFPAYYDDSYHSAVVELASRLASMEINQSLVVPRYLGFSHALVRTYLAYENLAARRGYNDLATHYLVATVR